MPIQSIEVICLPCPKCETLEPKIRGVIKSIEAINKVKIPFEFKRTTSLRDISKYSLSPAQTPVILVNGNVEFAGRFDLILVRSRLESIHKTC